MPKPGGGPGCVSDRTWLSASVLPGRRFAEACPRERPAQKSALGRANAPADGRIPRCGRPPSRAHESPVAAAGVLSGPWVSRTGAGGAGWPASAGARGPRVARTTRDRKSTRLNSSHVAISYAVFCLKKKKTNKNSERSRRVTKERMILLADKTAPQIQHRHK